MAEWMARSPASERFGPWLFSRPDEHAHALPLEDEEPVDALDSLYGPSDRASVSTVDVSLAAVRREGRTVRRRRRMAVRRAAGGAASSGEGGRPVGRRAGSGPALIAWAVSPLLIATF